MINFRCIARIEADDVEMIINEKYNPTKTILTGLKPKILERYSKYIEIETTKRLLPIAFTIDEKSNLTSFYGSKTRTAKKIIDDVLKMQNPNHSDYCLYCGIGEIDQIDHYLPQEHFPEFSILHKNLVPICGTCNEIKGSNIPGQNSINYMHLVYDILPIENIFQCIITYTNNLPTIIFSILPKFTVSVINSHFTHLRLKDRIEKKSIQYCLQIKALKDQFGNEYAREELDRDSKKMTAFFGQYYWRTELISQLISTNFIDSIN